MSFQLIRPSDIIERLRTFSASYMPALANRIAGAADFDSVEDKTRLATPSLFVAVSDNGVEILGTQTGFQGTVENRFDIILVLENADRRGQAAEELSIAYKEFLLAVLAGWKPSGVRGKGLQYAGDSIALVDRARYMRIYSFLQLSQFDSNEDGLGDLGDYDSLPWLSTIAGSIDNNQDEDVHDVPFELDGLDA